MKPRGRKNITYTQRLQLETLLNAKTPVKEIARQLDLAVSTVYKEIKKGLYMHTINYYDVPRYSAYLAQDRYEQVCINKGRPLKIGNDWDFVRYINKRVGKDKVSAGAVLGEIKSKGIKFKTDISKTTLYRYISLGFFESVELAERKKKYKQVIGKRAPRGTSIEQRPKEIAERNTFGHWEMDCVCGKTKTALLVLSERLTRQEIIFKIKNKKAETVVDCINQLEQQFGNKFSKIFKSITVDNGAEFSDFTNLEKSIFSETKRTSLYYCHPYSCYERGTNERINRDIRKLIPKGTNLAKYTHEEIQQVQDWVNNYPRAIFGYSTSNEMFALQMQQIA